MSELSLRAAWSTWLFHCWLISPPGAYGASLNDQVGSLLSFWRICGEWRLTNS
jgi:hypothetical protein